MRICKAMSLLKMIKTMWKIFMNKELNLIKLKTKIRQKKMKNLKNLELLPGLKMKTTFLLITMNNLKI